MALPSVIVTISENTFRPSSGEAAGTFVAGAVVGQDDIIKALGTTAEVIQGYIQFTSLEDLNSRLTLNSGNGAGYTFPGFSGGDGATYASNSNETRFPSGPSGATLRHQFHTIETAAQYGAQVITGLASASPFTSSTIPLDCIYAGDTSINDVVLSNIRILRGNDILTVNRHMGVDDLDLPQNSGNTKYDVWVYGTKEYIPDSSTIENEIDLYGAAMQINLAADMVGCMARTKRVANTWSSPAGFARGKILNVYRLVDPLTGASADALYGINVNPVLSFANQGILMFGDKTSTGDKIGITNLLLYLQEQVGIIAREALFEVNDASTRLSVTNRVRSLLQSVVNKFGIEKFAVTCDETNNPPEIANIGNFVLKVEYKPINSIETIILEFVPESETGSISAGG